MRQAKMEKGTFTFSLDFELAWGTRGRPKAPVMGPWLDGTRGAITELLDLLARHNVSATWASVGAMFLASLGKRHPWLSGPEFNDIPAGDGPNANNWYALDILEELKACPTYQEIGCHTLTHMYIGPGDDCRKALCLEMERFCELFDQLGLPPAKSFIYPKHKMAHYDVLAQYGITCFRGRDSDWFESLPGAIPRAAVRHMNARFAGRPRVDHCVRTPEGLWRIPSSQFYSPFMSVGRYVSARARVKKAIKGLRAAAATGGVYHLWTHPENLGVRTPELLGGLDEIFREAARLRSQGLIDILPMGAIADRLDAIESGTDTRNTDERVEKTGDGIYQSISA